MVLYYKRTVNIFGGKDDRYYIFLFRAILIYNIMNFNLEQTVKIKFKTRFECIKFISNKNVNTNM